MVGSFLTSDGIRLYRDGYNWIDNLNPELVDLTFESLFCGYPCEDSGIPLAGWVIEWWPRFKLRWTMSGKEQRLTVGCAVSEDLVQVGSWGDTTHGIVMPSLDFGGGWADDFLNEALPYGINEGLGYRTAAAGVIDGNYDPGDDVIPVVHWKYLPARIANPARSQRLTNRFLHGHEKGTA